MSWIVCPPLSEVVRPVSTIFGAGPVSVTSELGVSVTGPPTSWTELAVPGALTESSWSLPTEVSARKTPACPPGDSTPPSAGPSTKASLMVTPPAVASAPSAAGWNSWVGASAPASHPASAGTSTATAAKSRRRVQRVTLTASSIHSVVDGRKSYRSRPPALTRGLRLGRCRPCGPVRRGRGGGGSRRARWPGGGGAGPRGRRGRGARGSGAGGGGYRGRLVGGLDLVP